MIVFGIMSIVIIFAIVLLFILYTLSKKTDQEVLSEAAPQEESDAATSGQKLQTELSSLKDELAETRAKLQDTRGLEGKIATLKDRVQKHTAEVVEQTTVKKLNEDYQTLFAQADKQAREALRIIEMLSKENETTKTNQQKIQELEAVKETEEKLKGELESMKANLEKSQEDLDQAQKNLSEAEALKISQQENQTKIQELEQKTSLMHTKADEQAKEAVQVIEALQAEIDKIKQENQTLQENAVDKTEIENLEGEKNTLKEQVDQGLSQIKQLETELMTLRHQQQTMMPPNDSAQTEFKALYYDLKMQLDKMREAVQDIKIESSAKSGPAKTEKAGTAQQLKELQEINAFLLEKERTLQSELSKSRVEALGLKKICEDFKTKLEQPSKNS